MTNTNAMSDSQESALMDEETYKVIEQQFGGTLPLESINEELLAVSEDKVDTSNNIYAMLESVEKYKKFKEEEEEMYYPTPELFSTMLSDEAFTGQLNFQYSLGTGGTNQDWSYSEALDKVFIKMEKVLPMRFTWEPPLSGLYLRTAMVFMLEQYRSDPVKRCHNHMAPTNPINHNIDPQRIKHVVHCVNHASSIYQERNEHLSILTPLCTPEAGSQYVPVSFKFLCKNSCASGLNRRPTELVFTLEDHGGTVLGRRKLLVRVCSCPKRDRLKEEQVESTPMPSSKRKVDNVVLPSGKRMRSSCDTHVYKVELNIVGKDNYLQVLKNAFDIMAGQAARTGQHEFFKPYMDDILRKMP
ncbi:cellular tumor antigen p53 [Cataglyphis hispanica]|uniref:cellular tumor antigen p53 n=1 Tax=Cataglyphis hispanica TaxID=1086592 RepID=UPI00217F8873|nr:cellular tumor antigen p53 [Cataglyphis hispanica]